MLPCKGQQPTPRKEAGLVINGYNILMIGGETSQGITADKYAYSIIEQEWSLITFTLATGFKSTCFASTSRKLYGYGGISTNGYLADLWVIDLLTYETQKLQPIGDLPEALAYSNCYVTHEIDREIFVLFGGYINGSVSSSLVYRYDSLTNNWTALNQESWKNNFKGAAGVYTGNRIVVAGGVSNFGVEESIVEFDFETASYKKIGSLPCAIYYGGFAYVGSSIYSLFGGSNQMKVYQPESPNFNFLRIELNEDCGSCNFLCSPGTYLDGKVCKLCPAGTYSMEFGMSSCTKCPTGTYSKRKGLQGLHMCLLCEQGTYSSIEGSQRCLDCISNYYCPIGGSISKGVDFENPSKYINVSIQPSEYDNDSATSIIMYNVAGIFGTGFLLAAVLLHKHMQGTFVFNKLDIFKDSHNYLVGAPMMIKSTVIGAVFSMVFFVSALFVASIAITNYVVDNSDETKSLVPFAGLVHEVGEFTADIKVSMSATGYVDECSKNKITVTPSFMKFYSSSTHSSFENNVCTAVFTCTSCVIEIGAQVAFSYNEDNSYSSLLIANVTSTSSIPGEISSISQSLLATKGKAFRGLTSSIFSVEATASVKFTQYFTSDLSESSYMSETGYLVSALKLPHAGSNYNSYE